MDKPKFICAAFHVNLLDGKFTYEIFLTNRIALEIFTTNNESLAKIQEANGGANKTNVTCKFRNGKFHVYLRDKKENLLFSFIMNESSIYSIALKVKRNEEVERK